jgi:acyl-CoA reductase-like NAD-dependent aldehyde dehydrogenase
VDVTVLTPKLDAGDLATRLYVDGDWREAQDTFTDLNPATEEPLAEVASASAGDVDCAVRAARAALGGEWGAI